MRRREFITLLCGAAAAWPHAARAQQIASPRRIGVLLVGLSPEGREAKQFRFGLRDLGYTEGRDVVLEWRSANGDYHRVPELVADLIQSKVDVIVQDSTVGTEMTKRATSTVPIVMAIVLDPVGSGLVRALASPGGNVTGLSMMATELYPKRLQLLKDVNPQLTRAAVGGGVAACGAGAAKRDARGRLSPQHTVRAVREPCRCVRPGPEGRRLCRGTERCCRLSLCR